jgi:hypothetical protein
MSDHYGVSSDEENFQGGYPTREAAIDDAPAELDLEHGQAFYTCHSEPIDVPTFDVDRVIEDFRARAYDDVGEIADAWLDSVTREQETELEEALHAVWTAWLAKHGYTPRWFTAEDVEEHEAPLATDEEFKTCECGSCEDRRKAREDGAA